MPVQVLNDIVRDYFRLFVNRRAYTVQATHPDPETGRHYYYRPRAKGNGQSLDLTYETLRRHLEGEITIALYAINQRTPSDRGADRGVEFPRTGLASGSRLARIDLVGHCLDSGENISA